MVDCVVVGVVIIYYDFFGYGIVVIYLFVIEVEVDVVGNGDVWQCQVFQVEVGIEMIEVGDGVVVCVFI